MKYFLYLGAVGFLLYSQTLFGINPLPCGGEQQCPPKTHLGKAPPADTQGITGQVEISHHQETRLVKTEQQPYFTEVKGTQPHYEWQKRDKWVAKQGTRTETFTNTTKRPVHLTRTVITQGTKKVPRTVEYQVPTKTTKRVFVPSGVCCSCKMKYRRSCIQKHVSPPNPCGHVGYYTCVEVAGKPITKTKTVYDEVPTEVTKEVPYTEYVEHKEVVPVTVGTVYYEKEEECYQELVYVPYSEVQVEWETVKTYEVRTLTTSRALKADEDRILAASADERDRIKEAAIQAAIGGQPSSAQSPSQNPLD